MYANHQAKVAGQPLPYPNVEAPSVVAAPWRSFHNYGLAADFNLTQPKRLCAPPVDGPAVWPERDRHERQGPHSTGGRPRQRRRRSIISLAGGPRASPRPRPAPSPTPCRRLLRRRVGTAAPAARRSIRARWTWSPTLESGNRNIPQTIHDKNTRQGDPGGRLLPDHRPDVADLRRKAAGVDLNQYPDGDERAAQHPGSGGERDPGQSVGADYRQRAQGQISRRSTRRHDACGQFQSTGDKPSRSPYDGRWRPCGSCGSGQPAAPSGGLAGQLATA